MGPQITILAAGMGTRLGQPFPKPLTPLRDGRTILGQQLGNIATHFPAARVQIVIGFQFDAIMSAHPDELFVYNPDYKKTNTSKSLLRSLKLSADGGVLWFNGDVVFDPAILHRIDPLIRSDKSFVAVNTARVGDEEVKYTVDTDNNIDKLSKQVQNALGEAVGINYISSTDKQTLIECLMMVEDQDYFERGIELAIERKRLIFQPVDISDLYAVEVDFAADLDEANTHL